MSGHFAAYPSRRGNSFRAFMRRIHPAAFAGRQPAFVFLLFFDRKKLYFVLEISMIY